VFWLFEKTKLVILDVLLKEAWEVGIMQQEYSLLKIIPKHNDKIRESKSNAIHLT
jgi:hypothetical protein